MPRVVITGASGLVGSAIARAIPGAVALRHHDLDITDTDAVRDVVSSLKPDVLINTAVIGVDDCERLPEVARKVNVDGPAALADAAQTCSATFVHFSSNYVFGGDREGEPYTIGDQTHPVNIYGRTKLDGERAAAARCERTFVVRTSWVYGRGKDSFLSTVADRMRDGQSVKAISDTWASCTFVGDLVERLMLVLDRGVSGTYQIVNEGICSHETFAREAARLVSAAPELIEVTREADMQRQAKRPRFTPMRCLMSERLGLPAMRPWKNALADYLGVR